MIIAHLPAARWLWTARLADPVTGHVCNDAPLRAVRREGTGYACRAVHELDVAPGTLLVTTPAGMSSQGAGPWGGCHAVVRLGADGTLAPVPMEDAADALDPAGADARLHRRLAAAAGLGMEPRRVRLAAGHGLEAGTATEWAGYWAVVERVTDRQAWLRAPSLAEMRESGLPLARSDSPEAVAAADTLRGA